MYKDILGDTKHLHINYAQYSGHESPSIVALHRNQIGCPLASSYYMVNIYAWRLFISILGDRDYHLQMWKMRLRKGNLLAKGYIINNHNNNDGDDATS